MTTLFLFIFLTSLVITFATPELITGKSNTQTSVENSEYRSSKNISYVVGTQNASWAEAYVMCRQLGMELASITSIDEQNILENDTKMYVGKAGYQGGFWIAGNRNGVCTGDFVYWTTGKPVVYQRWSPGQPDNVGGIEFCIELHINDNWAWDDIACHLKIGFICQSLNCSL